MSLEPLKPKSEYPKSSQSITNIFGFSGVLLTVLTVLLLLATLVLDELQLTKKSAKITIKTATLFDNFIILNIQIYT